MTNSWACPNCQTLNIGENRCYSCGTARPGGSADTGEPEGADAVAQPEQPDLEPHPCWCNLVKGPHDVRDHPQGPGSTDVDPFATERALAHLKDVEVGLAAASHGWTDGQVERSYPSSDDGEQDYEDEAAILEAHGYTKLVERRQQRIDATYTSADGRVGPTNWTS